MGNKNTTQQKVEETKSNQIAKIMFLRKILRHSKQLERIRIFAKFGIGVTKYEICSNLKNMPQKFQIITTIYTNSNYRKTYELDSKLFSEQQIEIARTDGNSTQVEQIYNETMLISGGAYFNQQRFTIYQLQDFSENFQMQFSRYYHRTNFNKRNQVYIISGFNYYNNQWRDVAECEIYNLNSRSFFSIKSVDIPISTFGCDQTTEKIYTFGGYNNQLLSDQNSIQSYNKKLNQ